MALGMAPAPYELRFDTGRSCLDLVATNHPVERLDSVRRLRAWLTGAGLLPTGAPLRGADPDWLTAFRELRAHVAELVLGEIEHRPADTRSGARQRAGRRRAPGPPPPVRAADGTLDRALRDDPACARCSPAVARDAVDLLTRPRGPRPAAPVRGDNCPLVYLDTSRGRRRRWCSSEVCGNRERVARHRRRVALARA